MYGALVVVGTIAFVIFRSLRRAPGDIDVVYTPPVEQPPDRPSAAVPQPPPEERPPTAQPAPGASNPSPVPPAAIPQPPPDERPPTPQPTPAPAPKPPTSGTIVEVTPPAGSASQDPVVIIRDPVGGQSKFTKGQKVKFHSRKGTIVTEVVDIEWSTAINAYNYKIKVKLGVFPVSLWVAETSLIAA